jgi:hypothetical protein
MHLIVIADSKLCETGYILDHLIMGMIKDCASKKEIQIHIISNYPNQVLKDFCTGFEQTQLLTLKEAKLGMGEYQNAVVVHFGQTAAFLKGLPHYFVPINTPIDRTDLSIIKRYLLNQQFNKWVKSATKVVSFNDWSLHQLLSQYTNLNHSVTSIHIPFIEPAFLEWSEMSAAKEQISNGNNYLLIFAGVENITPILKEFSIFKKWQQSTMHLVFVLENEMEVNKANAILKGYKFKQDVSIFATNQVKATWLAASYLTVFEGVKSSSSYFVMHSIHYGVPLLFDDQIQLTETWKSAGEVFSFAEKNVLSNHFKLYYKDEIYRQSRATMGSNWLQTLLQKRSSIELFNNIVLSHIK